MERFYGILIGAASFLIIGICHPLVIKTEYRWTKRCWWIWLLAGIALAAGSLLIRHWVFSTILGVAAFSLFWGIHELFQQENRVLRGTFPMNPAHAGYYAAVRKKKEQKNAAASQA